MKTFTHEYWTDTFNQDSIQTSENDDYPGSESTEQISEGKGDI